MVRRTKHTWSLSFVVIVAILTFSILVSYTTGDSFSSTSFGIGTPEDFTLIVIPDTQYYARKNNGLFELQTAWMVKEKAARNIFFAVHEGDIVDTWDSEAQWAVASSSMARLDGVVPYGLVVGNHDMSKTRNTVLFNKYFGLNRYKNVPWYGSSFPTETNNNNYQTVSQNGMDFLFLNLQFCPETDVLKWADEVLKSHKDHRAVLTTHGYLNEKAERKVHSGTGGCKGTSNTAYLWDMLVYNNPNVFLVLSGHVHEESRRVDMNAAGEPVHQMLADYQNRDKGGNGWLRILTFKPAEDKIQVETYSPYLMKYETDENSMFEVKYKMRD
jgi:calcineurin-like phosphoesterase family protein